MLTPIKNVMENPDDVPRIPRALKEYLQVHYNAGFVMQMGDVAKLKQAGYSEAYIAGYLAGLQRASYTLDEMETRRDNLEL